MNKKSLIISLFVAGLVLSIAGSVSAAMMSGDVKASVNMDDSMMKGKMMEAAAITAEIRATFVALNSQCTALKSPDEVKACQDKIETDLIAKFPNINKDTIDRFLKARSETEDKSGEHKDNNGKDFLTNLSDRFNTTINRLSAIDTRLVSIADRIDSRISKLDSSIDTAASAKLVVSARTELTAANTSLTAAKTSFTAEMSAATTATPANYKTAFTKTLANIKAAKDHLKQAHKDLVQAVDSLKPGINKDLNNIKASGKVDIKGNI